jgi:hypothetical protein
MIRTLRGLERRTSSASLIQKQWQGSVARSYKKVALSSICCIQAIARAGLYPAQVKRKAEATVTVQKLWRAFQGRMSNSSAAASVRRLQTFVRRVLRQGSIKKTTAGSVNMQRYWRGCRERAIRYLALVSARRVQATYRVYTIVRELVKRRTPAALMMQNHWRASLRLLYSSTCELGTYPLAPKEVDSNRFHTAEAVARISLFLSRTQASKRITMANDIDTTIRFHDVCEQSSIKIRDL